MILSLSLLVYLYFIRMVIYMNKILSLISLFIFFFSSSTVVHAITMWDFPYNKQNFHNGETHNSTSTHDCHSHNNNSKRTTEQWSCIEHCLDSYDTILSLHNKIVQEKIFIRNQNNKLFSEYNKVQKYGIVDNTTYTRWPPLWLLVTPYKRYVWITLMLL